MITKKYDALAKDGGYHAGMILHSRCEETGAEVATMECRYPRFIHSEMLTHRAFSRNSASSRAIPFPKLLQQVVDDPVIPIRWGHDGGGMKQGEEVPDALRPFCLEQWLKSRDEAVERAKKLWEVEQTALAAWKRHGTADSRISLRDEDNMTDIRRDEYRAMSDWMTSKDRGGEDFMHRVHRSLPNRLVEPWMWITVIITATDWKNFFRLRCHEDAEPHMQKIADLMQECLRSSKPQTLPVGGWHLPFVTGYDEEELYDELYERHAYTREAYEKTLAEISTARVARVSYLTHDGRKDWRKDLELAEKLRRGSGFGHWSPTEHPCVAVAYRDAVHARHGNFRGFKQFRQFFRLENGDST